MTSIDELSLSGVRSFDPNPRNAQVIIFNKPLTVILGNNGAGKTTIIESLLYATTGEMPPGCNGSEKYSFVYDPKVAGESEIKAQIRLSFTSRINNNNNLNNNNLNNNNNNNNNNNKVVKVIRNFQVVQTKTKVTFQTLDSTIAFTDNNGKKLAQSHRGIDCDKRVPELLGVSKAVLEHVIFCHQEDSCWPLQNSSEVKKKFDEIFAATRYVAALDKLREVMKIYGVQLKELEVELVSYTEHKEQARNIQIDISEKKEKMKVIQVKNTQLGPIIDGLSNGLKVLNNITVDVDSTSREIASIQGRIGEKRRVIMAIQNKIKTPPQHSLEELNNMKLNFDGHMKKLSEEMKSNEGQMKIQIEKRKIKEDNIAKIKAEIDLLDREEEEHKSRIAILQETLSKLSTTFIPVNNSSLFNISSVHEVEKEIQEELCIVKESLRKAECLGEEQRNKLLQLRDDILRAMDAASKEKDIRLQTVQRCNSSLSVKKAELIQIEEDIVEVLKGESIVPSGYCLHPSSSSSSSSVTNNNNNNVVSGQNNNNNNATSGRNLAIRGDNNNNNILQKFAGFERQLESIIVGLETHLVTAKEARRQGKGYEEEEELVKEINNINQLLSSCRVEMANRDSERRDAARLASLHQELIKKTENLVEIKTGILIPFVNRFNTLTDNNNNNINNNNNNNNNTSVLFSNDTPLSQISLRIEQIRKEKQLQLFTYNEQVQAADRDLAGVGQQYNTKREELTAAERQLKHQSSLISNYNNNNNRKLDNLEEFDGMLETAEKEHLSRCQEVTSLEAMSKCYHSFVQQAKADNICAVCERHLPTETSLTNFININENRQKNTPQQLEFLKNDIVLKEEILRELRGIEPVVRNIVRLNNNIPQLTRDLRQLSQEVNTKKIILDDLRVRACEVERVVQGEVHGVVFVDLANANGIANDLDRIKGEIGVLERKEQQQMIMIQKSQQENLNNNNNSDNNNNNNPKPDIISFLELQNQMDENTKKINKLNERLHKVRCSRQTFGNNNNNNNNNESGEDRLQTDLLSKRSSLMKYKMLCRSHNDIINIITELEKEKADHNDRINNLQVTRITQQTTLDETKREIEKISNATLQTINKYKTTIEKCERNIKIITNDQALQVKEYISKNKSAKLNILKQSLTTAEAETQIDGEIIQKLEKDISETRIILDKQNKAFTGIEQSIELLQLRSDIEKEEQQCQNFETKLLKLKSEKLQDVQGILGKEHDLSSLDLSTIRETLQAKHMEISKIKAQQEGVIGAIESDIINLQTRLSQDKYHSIEKRHLSTLIKVQTTELAVKDLEKYQKALEKAVQTYHQDKILHINKIIQEIWRQTYRGSDIDTIEIRSDDDNNNNSNNNNNNNNNNYRRSYKYRVIMKRGNTELEMRGRCSTGQKVLASVVIRIALSEAFCCDCGVLALDEPTTNLDDDNSRSLASALKELINNRRNVRHFQLIIITHDEQFVRALGGQAVESFYFVHKDREGAFSIIEKKSYDKLF